MAAASARQWDSYIDDSVKQIQDARLERVLRPLVPDGSSAVQVCRVPAEYRVQCPWLIGSLAPNNAISPYIGCIVVFFNVVAFSVMLVPLSLPLLVLVGCVATAAPPGAYSDCQRLRYHVCPCYNRL
jgi:hypothetical protein